MRGNALLKASAAPADTRAGRYKQDYAYDRMKHAIISGVFPPEKLLVERELCEMLGVSRTPVREALRRLSSEGLVESHPGRGMFVTRLNAADARQIYELKEALERMAVRLCILRMTGGELEELGGCLTAHEQAYARGDNELVADMDLQFHILLVEFARSAKIEEHAKAILVQEEQIEALGQPFDPARHNAVMHVEDESAGENTVVEVFQQGYALGDKVLRFAMVKVAN